MIREHTDAIKPPRALWVPFELGRPLGVPNDPAFQNRALRACLELLDAESGPVLKDYPEDVPAELGSVDFTGMSCPIDLPQPSSNGYGFAQDLLLEIQQVAPWYDLAVSQRGRTTVGISDLDMEQAGRFLAGYIEDEATPAPRGDLTTGRLLKFVCEDLKAYYSEAASAQPGMSASIAVEHWLFNETVLGKLLWQLRNTRTEHEDDETRYFARRSLIPDRQIQYKGATVYHS
ncbi:MAG: hypothetical protein OXI54_15240 [Chloroflexota bacterium]|nr:hypothetical protein [Chloroflexota bacterium]